VTTGKERRGVRSFSGINRWSPAFFFNTQTRVRLYPRISITIARRVTLC
jgi:hypothetical protein